MSRASCHLQGPHQTMIIPHDTGLPFTPSHSGGIQQPPKKPTPCVSRSFLASLRIARDDDCPSPTWAWPIHHGHHIKGSTGTRRSPCHMCPGVPCHLQRFPQDEVHPCSLCLSLHAHATFTKDPKASEGVHATCVKGLPGISKDHMRG